MLTTGPEPVITFGEACRDFKDRYDLSVRDFAAACSSPHYSLSKTNAHRLISQTAGEPLLTHARAGIIDGLRTFLTTVRGLGPDEVEGELSIFQTSIQEEPMLTNRCMLPPAARRFFSLSEDPFDVDRLPSGNAIFSNDALDDLVEQVKDAVRFHRFVAVIGDVGTGKTLLKLRMASELEEEQQQVRLLYPEFFDMGELTVANIATAILDELGQTVPRDKTKRVTVLKQTLTQLQQEGIEVAMVIDEAHRLADKVISSLKNFWELTNGKHSRLLGLILFGQPAFAEARLRDVRFREIRQRVQILEMPRLNGSTFDYIKHRLSLAGGDIDDLFDPVAIERIAANARTPLAVGNLVNECLIAAFKDDEKRVTTDLPIFRKLGTSEKVSIRKAA